MSLKSILVHVDDTARSKRCLSVASTLAVEHDAHLVGLSVKPHIAIPSYAAAQMPQEVYAMYDEDQERLMASAKAMFEDTMRRAGWEARAEWRHANGDLSTLVASEGRGADLIVMGQEEGDDDPANYEGAPDRVLLESGRPVLMIPYTGARDTLGKRVVVAWSNTREAARALKDALPLIQQAEEVEVVSANPAEDDLVPGADVARYLSHHGIEPKVSRIVARDLGAENTLLNRVADAGADLLVMGAYGHARIRELVLGGVTHAILKHMTCPVLMSH